MEMWIGLIATSVAPLWPLFKRYATHLSTPKKGQSFPAEYDTQHRFSRHKFLPRSATCDSTPEVGDGAGLGSVDFRRLASRSPSQEAMFHSSDGIELTRSVIVENEERSRTRGPALGNSSFGGVYGQPQHLPGSPNECGERDLKRDFRC